MSIERDLNPGRKRIGLADKKPDQQQSGTIQCKVRPAQMGKVSTQEAPCLALPDPDAIVTQPFFAGLASQHYDYRNTKNDGGHCP